MRPTIDEYYVGLLPQVASRGTCPRRQVACIIVDSAGRMVSTGYNGSASGQPHCTEHPCPGSPELSGAKEACEATHAEANAVLMARDSRRWPATAYCSLSPCRPCADLLIGLGIDRLVYLDDWRHSDAGVVLLRKVGLEVVKWM